jgi:DHA2 family methylenomycin A resistance protein-like MFS transporter
MLGVAVFGFFVRDTAPDSFMQGMHLSMVVAAAVLVAGIAMCIFGIKVANPATKVSESVPKLEHSGT